MRSAIAWSLALAGCGPDPAMGPSNPVSEPPAPTSTPAPAPNVYSSDWEGMVTFLHNHCIACHAAGATAEPILPFEIASVVEPFEPDASVLWRVVSGAARQGEAPMPLGQPLLPPEEVGHVREWIALGAIVNSPDVDGDGWLPPEDCDDDDPFVYPFAPERCNGLDDNCEGTRDEGLPQTPFLTDGDGDGLGAEVSACAAPPDAVKAGGDCDDTDPAIGTASTWYPDDDEDGAGAPTGGVVACAAPAGTVATPDDCNDANPLVSPTDPERCNGIDDDCDLAFDEADAIDPGLWYLDADRDGFGDGVGVASCAAPDGFVGEAGDCDDGDPRFAPGAVEECTDPADYNCDGAVGFVDLDGDGFAACAECNDGDPAIFPGAVEVCNGVDDDCAGLPDLDAADAPTWYLDGDGDGFGVDAGAVIACAAPPLHVATGGDCNDLDPGISPTADETCNGQDDNCNDDVDGADALDPAAWYGDGDGDGFGQGEAIFACDPPAGTAAAPGDCDDADPSANPDAPEICGAPVDSNCDGFPGNFDGDGDGLAGCAECDDADPLVGLGPTWYADGDGDGYGVDPGAVVACDAPLGFAAAPGDCADGEEYVNPGAAADPIDGRDNDCDDVFDEDGPLSHTADIQPIWDAACTTGCHEAPGPSGGLDLAAPAFGRIVNAPAIDVPSMDSIAPFAPDDSYLWHKLQGTQASVGGLGLTMPKFTTLPVEDLARIEAWIVAGAPP